MTARDVLAEIEQRKDLRMVSIPDIEALVAALRAVLDLHTCQDSRPCMTVRAISEALGGAA